MKHFLHMFEKKLSSICSQKSYEKNA